jgi:DNA primase catalytic subunit
MREKTWYKSRMTANAEYRPSTLAERRTYYENEFSESKVKAWFRGRETPQLCAVDAGSETNVIIDRKLKDKLLYFHFSELKNRLARYVPEDVYYDRNTYKDPEKTLESLDFNEHEKQELAFDIDVDNIPCRHARREKVCNVCLSKAFGWAVKMKARLEEEFNKTRVVYSGRGFHIHVLDEKAFQLTIKEREKLNRRFSAYPLDPWVSRGYIRLIRMPYTLNALVSRIAKPVDARRAFDPSTAIPKFLKD